jgi:hypothetical protein
MYPKAAKKPESCAIRGSPRLVNEVSENNLTLTGNLWKQTPNKNKSRVVILSDSHLKGCTRRVNNYLCDKFRTFGWIKPGVLAEEILERLTVDLMSFKKRAGANNLYRNNPNKALINILNFIPIAGLGGQ